MEEMGNKNVVVVKKSLPIAAYNGGVVKACRRGREFLEKMKVRCKFFSIISINYHFKKILYATFHPWYSPQDLNC